MMPYEPPAPKKSAFNCPFCNAYANQTWSPLYASLGTGFSNRQGLMISICIRCTATAIWFDGRLVFPNSSSAPLANSDMPADVKIDFNEARDIVMRSPRSACVLLRLCVEKICDSLGATGGSLNEKIGKLVERGMNIRIQKALDAVRVIGGQAVHPLEMDLKDDETTANSLFGIVNLIVDWAYTESKKIDSLYSKLPDDKKVAVEKRDGKS